MLSERKIFAFFHLYYYNNTMLSEKKTFAFIPFFAGQPSTYMAYESVEYPAAVRGFHVYRRFW